LKILSLGLGWFLGLKIERKEMKLKYTIKSRNSKRRWVKSERNQLFFVEIGENRV